MRWKRDGDRDKERRRVRTEVPESAWRFVGEGSVSVPPPLRKDILGEVVCSDSRPRGRTCDVDRICSCSWQDEKVDRCQKSRRKNKA